MIKLDPQTLRMSLRGVSLAARPKSERAIEPAEALSLLQDSRDELRRMLAFLNTLQSQLDIAARSGRQQQ
ncbi:hypothetical protein LXM94_19825 [Rhizobium sp. TRM95111]|uniref:hypothetical protein n=1 Tax=Rhizobium alarense TaxID=2846851 RepID=UPI001F1E2DF2|nr:hypothetical protein [Rhizobium alarense]MCF3642222.1 hypothetical protein [Rhizobium alarense]